MGICRKPLTQKGRREKRKLWNDGSQHCTVILKKFWAFETGAWSMICHFLMFSCFYHARPKIALIPGVKRMEIQTMATFGSLVVHHWVIFPSLLLIQNALGGRGGCFQTAWRQMHWTLSPGAFCSQKNNSCTPCVAMFHSWLFQNLSVSTPWIFAIEQQKKRSGSQRESWGMLPLQRDPTTNQAERTCFMALPAATSSFGMM